MYNKFEFKYVELASLYDELQVKLKYEEIEKDVLIATVLRHERTIDELKDELDKLTHLAKAKELGDELTIDTG